MKIIIGIITALSGMAAALAVPVLTALANHYSLIGDTAAANEYLNLGTILPVVFGVIFVINFILLLALRRKR